MIRINLLEETRVTVKPGGGGGMSSFNMADNVGVAVMLAGIFAAGAGAFVVWLWLNGTLNTLRGNIAEAEEEKRQLQYVFKKRDELEAKEKALQKRIDIISELKKDVDKPVRMMTQLSICLAENVWLEDVSFSGDSLVIRGKALSKLNYANFLKELEKSPYFPDVATGTVDETSVPVTFQAEATFLSDPFAEKTGEAAEAPSSRRRGRRRR